MDSRQARLTALTLTNKAKPKPIADRHFQIEFLSPGVEAFAFTFG